MPISVQVIFRNTVPSPALEKAVQKEAEQLQRYSPRLSRCQVTVAEPHRHRQLGRLYSIRIDLRVAGREVVINHQHPLRPTHKDVSFAVRDAFHVARRRLEDRMRLRRHQVKAHETPPQGRVAKVFPEAGYGFIETADGREVYFHQASVLPPGFARVHVGDRVSFLEEVGQKGPNATSVRQVHPHRRPRLGHGP